MLRRPSVVVQPSTIFKDLLLQNHWANQSQIPWIGGTTVCSGHLCRMTKMAATSIYDKNPSKIFFSGNQMANDLGPWYVALGLGPIKICSNDDLGFTLTCFMASSNLVPYAFIWENLLESHLMEETHSK